MVTLPQVVAADVGQLGGDRRPIGDAIGRAGRGIENAVPGVRVDVLRGEGFELVARTVLRHRHCGSLPDCKLPRFERFGAEDVDRPAGTADARGRCDPQSRRCGLRRARGFDGSRRQRARMFARLVEYDRAREGAGGVDGDGDVV